MVRAYNDVVYRNKSKIQLAYILLIISAVLSEDHPYCFLESCPVQYSHTLCVYNNVPVSPRCGNPNSLMYGLRLNERNHLLNLYNEQRPLVRVFEQNEDSEAPGAEINSRTDDYLMQWDTELAAIAQKWANQCINRNDECRDVDRFKVRQRVGLITNNVGQSFPSAISLITDWFTEETWTSLNTSHLENLSWEETANIIANQYERMSLRIADRVGCGAVRGRHPEIQTLYLVCNFGPA